VATSFNVPDNELRSAVRADRRRVPRGGRRSTDSGGRYPRVIVADSYAGARIPYVRYLTGLGFDVNEADNGDTLLTLIEQAIPQVILMEKDLPRWPAWCLATWLDLDARTRDVPIILMAGDSDDEVPQTAGILTKPFQLPSMIEEVRRVLRAAAAAHLRQE
jgi:two-component system phosphate regulon response regulator PhoB